MDLRTGIKQYSSLGFNPEKAARFEPSTYVEQHFARQGDSSRSDSPCVEYVESIALCNVQEAKARNGRDLRQFHRAALQWVEIDRDIGFGVKGDKTQGPIRRFGPIAGWSTDPVDFDSRDLIEERN